MNRSCRVDQGVSFRGFLTVKHIRGIPLAPTASVLPFPPDSPTRGGVFPTQWTFRRFFRRPHYTTAETVLSSQTTVLPRYVVSKGSKVESNPSSKTKRDPRDRP